MLLGSCAPVSEQTEAETFDGEWPRVLTDALGQRITIPAPPERIIPIFASNTELLYELGLRSRFVAREEMARYPEDILELPEVGGRWGFSVEAVLSYDPDLVVLTPARQAAATLAEPLNRLGIPTIVLQHATVEAIRENLLLLGRATGTEERAEAIVANWDERLEAIADRLAETEPVTLFLETGSIRGSIISTPRPGSYTWDMLHLAGGVVPWERRVGPGQVSWESVLEMDPEYYLVARYDDFAEELAQRPGWHRLRAVRENKVIAVNRAQFLIPGPRVIDGIEDLSRILHPPEP